MKVLKLQKQIGLLVISIPTLKNLLEHEDAQTKWCSCKNAAFVKLPSLLTNCRLHIYAINTKFGNED